MTIPSEPSFKDRDHDVSASGSSIIDPLTQRSDRPPFEGGDGRGVRPSLDIDGILPSVKGIAKSTLWQRWILSGHGRAYSDCGEFGFKGCLNVERHGVKRSDGVSYEGKVFVKKYRRSCGRAECPICYEKWASREAHRAVRRLKAWQSGHQKPIHVIVSPSQVDCDNLDYVGLRRKAYQICKAVGILGGVCIIHPFRERCVSCGFSKVYEEKICSKCGNGKFEWYLSPHFHTVVYGWVKGQAVGAVYEREGWVVKNLGVRNSVYATLHYQLSHAGVYIPNKHESPEPDTLEREGKKATVTWFGALSYNKLKVPKEEGKGKEVCPICGASLLELEWIHLDRPPPLPDEEGEYYPSPDGWRVLMSVRPKDVELMESEGDLDTSLPEVDKSKSAESYEEALAVLESMIKDSPNLVDKIKLCHRIILLKGGKSKGWL